MKAPDRNKPAKGPLDEAIEALALACESGGELDHATYVAARQRLEKLKADITAHDQKLNQSEAVPGGDDYNQIVEMMLSNHDDTAQSQQIDLNTDPAP